MSEQGRGKREEEKANGRKDEDVDTKPRREEWMHDDIRHTDVKDIVLALVRIFAKLAERRPDVALAKRMRHKWPRTRRLRQHRQNDSERQYS